MRKYPADMPERKLREGGACRRRLRRGVLPVPMLPVNCKYEAACDCEVTYVPQYICELCGGRIPRVLCVSARGSLLSVCQWKALRKVLSGHLGFYEVSTTGCCCRSISLACLFI